MKNTTPDKMAQTVNEARAKYPYAALPGHFMPDWQEEMDHDDLQELLAGEFKGPGWYIGKDSSTLLVIVSFTGSKEFLTCCWAVNPAETFNMLANMPTKLDRR